MTKCITQIWNLRNEENGIPMYNKIYEDCISNTHANTQDHGTNGTTRYNCVSSTGNLHPYHEIDTY